MNYTACNPNSGEVLFTGTSDTPGGIVSDGLAIILFEHAPPNTYRAEGEWIEIPTAPSAFHVWSWTSKTWSDPRVLQDHKDAKWADIRRLRAAALVAPTLETRFGVFDATAEAVTSIKDTVVGLNEAAKIGVAPAFVTWTMADNSALDLTPAELSEVAALLLMRGDAAYVKARALRAQIEAATTVAEVEAVAW